MPTRQVRSHPAWWTSREAQALYWGPSPAWTGDRAYVTYTNGDPEGVLGSMLTVHGGHRMVGVAVLLSAANPKVEDHRLWWAWWIKRGREQVEAGRKGWHGLPGPPRKRGDPAGQQRHAPVREIEPPSWDALRRRVQVPIGPYLLEVETRVIEHLERVLAREETRDA